MRVTCANKDRSWGKFETWSHSRLAIGIGVLLALLVAGCGAGKGDISGQVTYKGQPLEYGRITFIGTQESRSGYIRNGKYEVASVPAGPVQVTIESLGSKGDQPAPRAAGNFGAKPKGVITPPMSAMLPPSKRDVPPEAASTPLPTYKYTPIPNRYSNQKESGLDFTVTSGKQTKDFELTP